MEQKKLDRISFLAHKSKREGLSDAERAEQAALRREYIDAVVGDLRSQLDNTYLVDEKGNKTKLKPRSTAKPQ